MLSNYYYKYHNSIKVKSESDTERMFSTSMSLLIEQSIELERLGSLVKTSQNN